jgi:uncharacterized protein YjbJ (UPF0337 family)
MARNSIAKEWLEKNLKNFSNSIYPEYVIRMASDTKLSVPYCKKILREVGITQDKRLKVKKKKAKGIVKEIFLKQFDIPHRILEGVENKLKGLVMEENDFRNLLEITADKLKRAIESHEFGEYRVKANGKWYWAQKDTIKNIIETMDLY